MNCIYFHEFVTATDDGDRVDSLHVLTKDSAVTGAHLCHPTARNHFHNCGHSPHDTHHLFVCPSKTTTLTVESLWTAPTETAKHLNLAFDETS